MQNTIYICFIYVCKTYVEVIFEEKLQLFRKRKSPQFLYLWASVSYLPQHCLYFLPLPHVEPLKQPCNFLLENWAFLLKSFNSLLINCNKVMSNFLTMRFKLI